jgi:hypothetical protein
MLHGASAFNVLLERPMQCKMDLKCEESVYVMVTENKYSRLDFVEVQEVTWD